MLVPISFGFCNIHDILHRKSNQRPLDADPPVLSITLMLLLLVGLFGLFAGLVFLSEGVIEPESTS